MTELKTNLLEEIQDTPWEEYTFRLHATELASVKKFCLGKMRLRMILSLSAALCVLIISLFSGHFLRGFAVGLLFVQGVVWFKTFRQYKKILDQSLQDYEERVFNYRVYDGFITVWITEPNAIRQQKCSPRDIKTAQVVGNLVVLEIKNQLYCLNKDELIDTSYFLSICKKK